MLVRAQPHPHHSRVRLLRARRLVPDVQHRLLARLHFGLGDPVQGRVSLDVLRGLGVLGRRGPVPQLPVDKVLARDALPHPARRYAHRGGLPQPDMPRDGFHFRQRTSGLLAVLAGCAEALQPLERPQLRGALRVPRGHDRAHPGAQLLRFGALRGGRLRLGVPVRGRVQHPGGADVHPPVPAQVPSVQPDPEPGVHGLVPQEGGAVPQIHVVQAADDDVLPLRRRPVAGGLLGLLRLRQDRRPAGRPAGLPDAVRVAPDLALGRRPVDPLVVEVAADGRDRRPVRVQGLPRE
mmetsp:Transcript_18749/g.56080  ORF Transcript_18749/g.56080 Transcript_18749/m.56080 type:complete len:293 (+) Transcript_18749:127-1005(+)